MKSPLVNMSIQILPKTKGDVYAMVDKAIEVVQKSGVKYTVCPFETVMEGEYETLIKVADAAQQACFDAGCEEVLVFLKIQRRKNADVTMEEKVGKYQL